MDYQDPVPLLAMWLLAAPIVLALLSLSGTKTNGQTPHRDNSAF